MSVKFEVYTRCQVDGTPNANDILQETFSVMDAAVTLAESMVGRRPYIIKRSPAFIGVIGGKPKRAADETVKVGDWARREKARGSQ